MAGQPRSSSPAFIVSVAALAISGAGLWGLFNNRLEDRMQRFGERISVVETKTDINTTNLHSVRVSYDARMEAIERRLNERRK